MSTLQHMVAVEKSDPKQEFAARLHKACDIAGLPKGRGRRIRLAELFHISGEAVRKWLDGTSIPNTKRIPEIANKLGVRGEWLLTGSGPMTDKPEPGIPNIDMGCLTQALEALDILETEFGKPKNPKERAEFLWELYKINKELTDSGAPPMDSDKIIRLFEHGRRFASR